MTWEIGRRGAGRVARSVKGMFVSLALVVALGREEDPLPTLLALIGAIVAFIVGEMYDAAIETQIRRRHGLRLRELGEIGYEQSFIAAGAVPSIVIFIFASAGVIDAALADNLAVYIGVGLLGALGWTAGRLAGERMLRCLLYGFEAAFIGALVIAFKVLVKP
ncbi:MAG TPA: hypothetical protein VFV41_09955 [Streptosporangiaceae bacterium]|nr:hypothetical protein [Streptosporangiaceae bacterium]